MDTWVQYAYLLCGVALILALKGLTVPRIARHGHRLGAAAVVVACVLPFFALDGIRNVPLIVGAIVLGTVVGLLGARRGDLAQVPQGVALLTGLGGAAAALVALVALHRLSAAGLDAPDGRGPLVAVAGAIALGAISFSGSVLAAAKLHGFLPARPVAFAGLPVVLAGSVLVALVLSVSLVTKPGVLVGVVLALLGVAIGLLLVLVAEDTEAPPVVPLLKAATGLAVAAGGYVLASSVLVIAGALVAASGAVLTVLVVRSSGRSVDDAAFLLANADRVIVVPGYGLAVAQAQNTLRELVDALLDRGVEVDYALHPVAGRMPGHMNVLLDEARVPHEQLAGIDQINPAFATTDVVLVVGANDVVNPAARTTPAAPLHGMPILDADAARRVIVLKRTLGPGYAGIENELFRAPTTSVLLGDAKDTLVTLVSAVRTL